MTQPPGEFVTVTATREPVVIWSAEHRAWWGPNRCGYTTAPGSAGHYLLEEAVRATRHVGPEKLIRIENPPSVPRSDADYAIEFGEYLAKAVEALLDDPETEIDSEHYLALRSAIGEFRKREHKVPTAWLGEQR